MSITDELRAWFKDRLFMGNGYAELTAIADRIDAEHEEAIQQALIGDGGVPATDENMAEHGWVRKDKEHIISHATIEVTPHIDWSRMADELNEFVEIVRGMLIVGHSSTRTNGLKLRRTQMQFTDEQQRFIDEHYQLLPKDADGEYIHVGDVMEWPDGETFDVIGIGDGVLFYTESECDGPAEWTGASNKRHYHAPTVEDVMVEFATDWESAQDGEDKTAVLKEYASKLRLAEGEDA